MHPYWQHIIHPILSSLHPKVIVEIGSEKGKNTKRLLSYCKEHDTVLHAIDPTPRFDVEAWQQAHGDRLVFHRALSLDALPAIGCCDVLLIDGDHNWYTVYHELKIIEQQCDGPISFPLVFIHDVGWPYGRRDLYYNPDKIPESFRQPFEKKGICLGISSLQVQGGVNASLNNAMQEHTPRNGVLTAVEDFLEETSFPLEWIVIPGFHDLGILFQSELRQQNPDLAALLDSWALPTPISQYVDRIEAARLAQSIQVWNLRTTLRQRDLAWRKKVKQLEEEKQSLTTALKSHEAERMHKNT